MRISTIGISVLTVLTQAVLADRNVQFVNKCPYPFYYWVVGPASSNLDISDRNHITVPANSALGHAMIDSRPWGGGGMVLKVRDVPYYAVKPAGILQVEYTIDPEGRANWYDMSYIDCDPNVDRMNPSYCPLRDGGITLEMAGQASNANCPKATCEYGVCTRVYDKPGAWAGEPSFACDLNSDIIVTTCTHDAGPTTFDWKKAPNEGTATVPAPIVPAPVVPSPIASNTTVSNALSPLAISPNGTCGGSTGYECEGSPFGDCCSAWGWCGSTHEHCGTVPQNTTCTFPEKLPVPSRLPNVSTNGLCGAKNGLSCESSQFGNCCSRWNFCGATSEYCEDGCQDGFGLCSEDYKQNLAMNVTVAGGFVTRKT